MADLEKFINDNREAFDQEEAPLKWQDVSKELETSDSNTQLNDGTIRIKKWWLYSGVAASMLVLVGSIWFFSQQNSENTKVSDKAEIAKDQEVDPQQEPALEEVSLADVSEDYAEIEAYYVVQVKSKVEELQSLNPDPEFMEDLDDLEEEYTNLKKELGAGGDDEMIIEAMIENYRLKLQVLEDILSSLKEQNIDDYGVEI